MEGNGLCDHRNQTIAQFVDVHSITLIISIRNDDTP